VPLDEFKLLFAGKKDKEAKKSSLSAEEIADLKHKESKAPLIRSALPTILKLWSPLPQKNNANIKYGNITKFVTDLKNSPAASRSTSLLQGVQALVDTPQPNELHKEETKFFNELFRVQQTLNKGDFEASILLNALPTGQLKDACIAYVLQKRSFGGVRQAAAKELQAVHNPALRASLGALVAHSPDFAFIRQSLEDGNAPQTESSRPLIENLQAYPYHPQVSLVLKKLYYDRPSLPDELKRQAILENISKSNDYYSAVPLLAALGTFYDPKKRAEFSEELQQKSNVFLQDGLHLANRIQATERIAQMDEATALPTLAGEALKPFIDRGFSLLDAPKLTSLLEKTGRDASALITTILPEYDAVLDFALKHPDKLVKTGTTPPGEDEIRARFHQQGVFIMQALILTGVPTLKNTIHRKRLDNLLEMMPTVTECSSLLKPAYQLSKITAEAVDNYKLVEFMAGFSELHKEKALKTLLDKMVQNKKLDIKTLGKAYLATVLGGSVLKDVQIADDQIDKWDFKYLSTLASALRNWHGEKQEELVAICKAALQGDIQPFLHDPATKVGKNNLATQQAFETTFKKQGLQLDYQKWLHYPGEVVFKHLSKNDEKEAIFQDANDLFLEIQTKHPALWPQLGTEFSKQNFLMEDGTLQRLPHRRSDESRLREILHQESIFKEPALKERAKNLSKRIGNLGYAPPQTQQMKIKLWERSPGTDLFLGNYAGACIALDSYGDNSYTSVQANQNTFVQVAYLRDESNRVVGLGLLYWGKNIKTGKPVLILNTFEGRARGSGFEHNMQVRDKYVEFAKQYSRAVLGYAAPLYTGTQYNPLYRNDLEASPIDMHVVGSALHNDFYLDSLPDDGNNIDAHHQPNNELQLLDKGETPPQVLNLSPTTFFSLIKKDKVRREENTDESIAEARSVPVFGQSLFVIKTGAPSKVQPNKTSNTLGK
jgi:hypothetical protein